MSPSRYIWWPSRIISHSRGSWSGGTKLQTSPPPPLSYFTWRKPTLVFIASGLSAEPASNPWTRPSLEPTTTIFWRVSWSSQYFSYASMVLCEAPDPTV